jgi:zinc transport system ATP-binding protein
MIKFNNVQFTVDSQTILKDVNFEINQGEFVALVGSNGAGKSTIIKALLGLKNMSHGTIHIGDQARIGYLSQYLTFQHRSFPASVKEVIESGLVGERISDKEKSSRLNELLSQFEIVSYKHQKIGVLSGGQLQRVLICRMLISNPNLLILDEPTSSLDPSMRERFYELLQSKHKQGMTILLVTHDVASIGEKVDRIIYLDQTILFDGTFKVFCEMESLTPFIHIHERDHHHE